MKEFWKRLLVTLTFYVMLYVVDYNVEKGLIEETILVRLFVGLTFLLTIFGAISVILSWSKDD